MRVYIDQALVSSSLRPRSLMQASATFRFSFLSEQSAPMEWPLRYSKFDGCQLSIYAVKLAVKQFAYYLSTGLLSHCAVFSLRKQRSKLLKSSCAEPYRVNEMYDVVADADLAQLWKLFCLHESSSFLRLSMRLNQGWMPL